MSKNLRWSTPQRPIAVVGIQYGLYKKLAALYPFRLRAQEYEALQRLLLLLLF